MTMGLTYKRSPCESTCREYSTVHQHIHITSTEEPGRVEASPNAVWVPTFQTKLQTFDFPGFAKNVRGIWFELSFFSFRALSVSIGPGCANQRRRTTHETVEPDLVGQLGNNWYPAMLSVNPTSPEPSALQRNTKQDINTHWNWSACTLPNLTSFRLGVHMLLSDGLLLPRMICITIEHRLSSSSPRSSTSLSTLVRSYCVSRAVARCVRAGFACGHACATLWRQRNGSPGTDQRRELQVTSHALVPLHAVDLVERDMVRTINPAVLQRERVKVAPVHKEAEAVRVLPRTGLVNADMDAERLMHVSVPPLSVLHLQ